MFLPRAAGQDPPAPAARRAVHRPGRSARARRPATPCATWPGSIAAAPATGPTSGIYAERLLDDKLPWTRMRSVYRLLGLVRRYGAAPVDTACGAALDLDVVSVTKIAAMLEKATEQHAADAARRGRLGQHHPGGRFARDPGEYAPSPRIGGVQLTLIHGGPPTGIDHQRRRRPMTRTTTAPPGPIDPVGADLKGDPASLKLGQLLDTLPERLALARQQQAAPRGVPRTRPGRRGHPPRHQLGRAARPRRRPRPRHASGDLGRTDGLTLRPHTVDRPDQPAVPRGRPRGPAPGPGRGRQDPSGHRARPHRGAPTPHACTWPAPTSCSSASRPPGSTTLSTPNCAASPTSKC